jgi:L-ascorbate metabolism protein UlaG (beta-lactamase superfamily)
MDLQFYGANCITLSTKGVRVVIDDNLAALGARNIVRAGDIALFTQRDDSDQGHGIAKIETKLVIDHGGEYEVSDISIYGIPARSHMDEAGKQSATMYKIISRELSIFITGHIYPDLNDDQLESIGMVDVMCIPVGGNGYTLDPVGALKIIKKIEPKLIIPTHYDIDGLAYEVPQQTLQQAITSLSMEPKETVQKLRLKAGEFGEETTLVILDRS